jgi:outer membrane protein assembly factor BamB
VSRARALLPLAVLVSILVTAGLLRSRAPRPPPGSAAQMTAAPGDAGQDTKAASSTLRGVRAEVDAAVASAGGPRMLHGDACGAHRARGKGPREARVVWSVDFGSPIEAQVTSSPDQQTLYIASLGGSLSAVARENGMPKWRVPLGERSYSTPCVADDGTIYVGSDAKKLRAIEPRGAVLWTIETDGEADTAPLITPDGLVVFAAGSTLYGARRGGDVAWRYAAKGKIFTAPALGPSGLVFFGAQDDRVYAVRASNGQLAWSTELGADVDGGPSIGDAGEIFVGTDGGEVVRLDDSGAVTWRTNVGGFVRGALAVARNGDVLAGVYGPSPRQVRLDGKAGGLRGAFPIQGTGAREFGVHGGAVEDADGTLFFGAQDDRVYGVDVDGRSTFLFATNGDVDAPITLLDDGAIVVASDDGKVYLLAP